MLASTRLSINMLDRAGRVPVPGLPNGICSEKSEGTACADATYRRALVLATRIARVSDLTRLPLPEAILAVRRADGMVTNGAESPLLEASQPVQMPVDNNRGNLAVSMAGAASLPATLLSTRRLGKSEFLDTLAPARSTLSAVTSLNRPSPSTSGYRDDALGLPEPSMPTGVMAAIAVNRPDNTVARRRSDKPLPMKLIDEVLAASTSTPTHETRLPASVVPMSKMPASLVDAVLRHPERSDLATKQTTRSTAALGLAAVLKPHRKNRVSEQLTGEAERCGSLPAPLLNRGSPKSWSGLVEVSDSRSDLRQRAVPITPVLTRYRTLNQEAVRRNSKSLGPAQASGREDIDSSERSLAPSQAINIVGALTVDNRHLGRLTASSQAREASLPARGPSRVNLRAVPIFSGMKIPS